MAPGFLTRDEVKQRYAERSGRDLSEIDFYVALGLWKLAIILEGVFARYAAGQYGEPDESSREFARIVERLAEQPPRPKPVSERFARSTPSSAVRRCLCRHAVSRGLFAGGLRPAVELAAGDDHLVDLVGAVGDCSMRREAPHPGERRVVGHAERAVAPGSRGRARP